MKNQLKYAVVFMIAVSFSFGACDNYEDTVGAEYKGNTTTYNDRYNLNLRDTGPAGGWIFYINPNADTDGWKYLEAAPDDIESGDKKQWGGQNHLINGTSEDIGTGSSNTTIIADFHDSLYSTDGSSTSYYDYAGDFGETDAFTDGTDNYTFDIDNDGTVAAKLCVDYAVVNGDVTYDKWFLPSKVELDKMYINLKKGTDENDDTYTPVGGFAGDYYWSSSEGCAYGAWGWVFSDGSQGYHVKRGTGRVRAIRAF